MSRDPLERPAAVVFIVDREAGQVEVEAQQLANRRFVFDDERPLACRLGHAVILGRSTRSPMHVGRR